MPGVIDPETMNVDELPVVWSPVQWELTGSERAAELEAQATASLLWAVDVPEALLRLLLGETEIGRVFSPPRGYDLERQGEWDESLVTFAFRRTLHLIRQIRERDRLLVEYDFEDLGHWVLEIEPEKVTLERL